MWKLKLRFIFLCLIRRVNFNKKTNTLYFSFIKRHMSLANLFLVLFFKFSCKDQVIYHLYCLFVSGEMIIYLLRTVSGTNLGLVRGYRGDDLGLFRCLLSHMDKKRFHLELQQGSAVLV